MTSVVDLSKAVTLGDVARLIEQGAPTGTRDCRGGHGHRAEGAARRAGTISVGEVAEGHAARELGILTPTGAAPSEHDYG